MSRVLIISEDTVGRNMAGPAIRCFEFARALSARHEVTLAVPGSTDLTDLPFQVAVYDAETLSKHTDAVDVIVASGYLLRKHPFLKSAGKPLVADIYDPYVLENLEIHRGKPMIERTAIHAGDLGVQLELLLRGDFFLCASERQRDFWLGMLTALNRVNPGQYDSDREARRLIDVVPFGIPAEPPVRERPVLKGVVPGIRDTDKVLLWGGGIWNWFDPLTLLQAMAVISRDRDDIKLFFLGTKHPNPDIPEMEMASRAFALADELKLTGKTVFFNDWAPYADRQNYLLEADAAVSLHFNHLETKFSFRTRFLDCLWAALPVITTRGDSLAELTETERLGVTIAAEDVAGAVNAILKLIDDTEFNAACRANLAAAAPDFHWERVIEPLARFCDSPYLTHSSAAAALSASELAAGAPAPRRSLAGRIVNRLRRR
jgi:glycosyltransferase involved in cell wall biosynthesis